MELPAKMRYNPALYVKLHRTLYPTFGKTAGFAEIVAVLTTTALAWRDGRRLTAGAAACLGAVHDSSGSW
jgi:hypothetical protein